MNLPGDVGEQQILSLGNAPESKAGSRLAAERAPHRRATAAAAATDIWMGSRSTGTL